MKTRNKLELTWIGKDDKKKIEPRILKYDEDKSYGDKNTGNMLIHGDNLLALKSLEANYSGKIKCIYIDPPYNTGAAFDLYNDNLEHSIWLSLMKERLLLLKKLLSDDGLIFIQIDDNEQAYLTVLMDELFGRKNHLNTICVKMSEATGVKMTHANKRLPKLKEYILVYKKSDILINQIKIPKEKWDSEYKYLMINISPEEISKIKTIMNMDDASDEDIKMADNILKNVITKNIEEYFKENKITNKKEKEKFKYDNAWRILRDVATTEGAKSLADEKKKNNNGNYFLIKTKQNKIYLIKNKYNSTASQPRIKMLFADDYLMINPCDLWLDITTTGLEAEGNVEFKNSKKPEKLIQRCIELSTQKGDYVLDSFLGSGTTIAVAHKMKRKWIGIEMGNQVYSHCKPRIDSIIDGLDKTGITNDVSWDKGGGYDFYELAPSLLNKDKYNNWVISDEYDADMLAEAMCLHHGFKYIKDQDSFYKQGYSTEKDFIYTTTNYVTIQYLDMLHECMNDDESLIMCCKSFDEECIMKYNNITVEKIPQSILKKYEFGDVDYTLNIEDEIIDEEDENE